MIRKNFKLYDVGKVGPKGQVVIPVEARRELGLEPGDTVVLAGMSHHKIVMMMERSSFERHLGFMQRRHGMFKDILDKLDQLDQTDKQDA
ncbi:MAG: AbrB/MazE/SpoVT family DNA-binding domain-containing protein [Candidatus Nomurabacteria bacterium]|jgi:AbrB family looped-hinge helix DNA binding protein|nr:AbrB/MazE/SpoVT family DNA-binding domain-containing protein [Candidatus Nomurabacteria bacterium]